MKFRTDNCKTFLVTFWFNFNIKHLKHHRNLHRTKVFLGFRESSSWIACFSRYLYSWPLDHSSISRARRTGKGWDNCLVWAFLGPHKWTLKLNFNKKPHKMIYMAREAVKSQLFGADFMDPFPPLSKVGVISKYYKLINVTLKHMTQTWCTNQWGWKKPCHMSELAPRMHLHLAGQKEMDTLQPVSSKQRWPPLDRTQEKSN